MGELCSLPNVGKVLVSNLNAVGINTIAQLLKIGSKAAFLRIRIIDSGACLHMLYGLEGAVEGIKDSMLSEETKRELKYFFKNL